MSSLRLLRTLEAITDLDGIWDYVARDSPAAADRLVDELNECFTQLSNNPEIGERQPLLADGTFRRFTHRSYVIYYCPLEDGIVLVRVLHGARDHESLL